MKIYLFSMLLFLQLKVTAQSLSMSQQQYALVIHGGAGTISKENLSAEKEQQYHKALQEALQLGNAMLNNNSTAIDVVEAVVKYLEDNPLFNAGKGAVMTAEGKFELDASIMDGKTLNAGAVARLSKVKNPVSAARLVMEKSQHVMLVGDGAEKFCKQHQLPMVNAKYFKTNERWNQYLKLKEKQKHTAELKTMTVAGDEKFGTVGAVALDNNGNLAAATSTGGMMNKMYGRIGDSPIIGAGTYADNRFAAISCTGHGEYFIKAVAAYDVVALMQYSNFSVEDATRKVIFEKLLLMGGTGGLIAIDAKGNIAMPFSTSGMYRGYVKAGEKPVSFIYKD